MTKADALFYDVVERILANPDVSPSFKSGIREAAQIHRDMVAFEAQTAELDRLAKRCAPPDYQLKEEEQQ